MRRILAAGLALALAFPLAPVGAHEDADTLAMRWLLGLADSGCWHDGTSGGACTPECKEAGMALAAMGAWQNVLDTAGRDEELLRAVVPGLPARLRYPRSTINARQ